MDKAFDAVFQTEVDAEVIAKRSYYTISDRFRYQCLCCGEEVYLAAADSVVKSPHFRHRRGNNDTVCERYLGQPGAVEHYISIRKHNKEYIGFWFNIERMTFEISLMYTTEEIESHAKNVSTLCIYTKYYSDPFFTMLINRSNLIPNVYNYFTLNEYSNDYYISIDTSNAKTVYTNIIKKDCKLNIYRINKLNNHCKCNVSGILYTNYNYLAISENVNNIRELICLQSVESDAEEISFITQERIFYAVKFVIRHVNYSTEAFFKEHDFELENSENMSVLWPPVFKKESDLICATEKVYLSSSFEWVPHGNIMSNGMDIQNICNDVYEVAFKDWIMICEKNIKSRIIKENGITSEITYEEPKIICTDKYSVTGSYDYYLFDQNGCSELTTGSNVYLSGTDRIIGYKNGHVKAIVLANTKEILDKKLLINDIMKYHPQSEPFRPDDFMDIEADEVVLSYIESCYRNGQINTVIKRYIKEGLI